MKNPQSSTPKVPSTKAICVRATQTKHSRFALKQKLLLTCLAIIFSFSASAQIGSSCANAQAIIIGNNSSPVANPASSHNPSVQTQTSNTNYWYNFKANETTKIIKLVNKVTSPLATSIKVYSGTCNNPTLIGSGSIVNTASVSPSGFNDSIQVTVSRLIIGRTYLIEVSGNAGAKNYALSINSVLTSCSYGAPIQHSVVSATGCELVNNGGFEQHSTFGSGFSQPGGLCYIYNANGWFNPAQGLSASNPGPAWGATPDYFYPDYTPTSTGGGQIETSENGANCEFDTDVPSNANTFSWGHDPTITSNSNPNNASTHIGSYGYAGLYGEDVTVANNPNQAVPPPANAYYSEYIGTTLRQPLVCGVTYQVSYWIQSASNYFSVCNGMGVMLSKTLASQHYAFPVTVNSLQYQSTYMVPDNVNSFAVYSTSVINTTGSWQKLTFTYVAKGGETYLYIGNFNPTSSTIQANSSHPSGATAIDGAYYIIDDVSLQPMTSPLAITGMPATALCSSVPEVLTATGGFSTPTSSCGGSTIDYTWSTGQTGSQITIDPTTIPTASTTVGYTVTASIPSLPSCTFSTAVTATVDPAPICPTIGSSICSNQTNTITVSNAQPNVNYTWLPATGVTPVANTNGSQVVITNPVAGTVYSVTASFITCGIITNKKNTNGLTCCTCTSTFTVSASPSISITHNPSPALICTQNAGASVTLNATSTMPNYSWLPATGLNNAGVSDPIATPASTTIYTVTTTDPTTGCTAQDTVTVFVEDCRCTKNQYRGVTITQSNAALLNTVVEHSFNNPITTISGNVTFHDEVFYFAPNCTLVVANNASLTLTHCHLLACTDMWQGIVVQPGGKLIVQDSSMIEDAFVAINCDSWLQPATSNTLTVDGCVFNRNKTGIVMSNYTFASNFPATIKDAVFTSRTLPTTVTTLTGNNHGWTTSATPQHAKSIVAVAVLQTPYKLGNTPTWVPATMKAPLNTVYANYGIYLNNVGTSNTNGVAILPLTYNDVTIGNTVSTVNNLNLNLFDGIYYGVYGLNSNFTCMNNAFELINAYPFNPICFKCFPPPVNPYPNSGTAIYGVNTLLASKQYNRAQVIYPNYNPATNPNTNNTNYFTPTFNNQFYDVVTGVNLNNYQEVHVAGTNIRSKQNKTIVPFNNAPSPGTYGIIVTSSTYKYNYLRYNLVTNINNGIVFHGTGVATGVTNLGFGGVNADNNNVTAYFNSNPTTEYVGRAITLDNMINCFTTSCPTNLTFSVTANFNNIQNVYSGIEMSDWFSPKAKRGTTMKIFADNNYVSTVQNSITPTATQYGINANNCNTHSISNNNIHGFGITNFNVRGIYSVDNTASKVYCNNTVNITKGFEFEGISSGFGGNDFTTWQNNTMNTNAQGFALTNACILGQQGSATLASDNQWTGVWTGNNFGTYVDGSSDATLSPIYVQANSSATSSTYYPQNSSSANPGVTDYISLAGTALFFNATPSGNVCATSPQAPCTKCPVNGLRLAERLVQDSIPFIILPIQSTYRGQLKYYHMLLANDSLADSSVVLQNFYVANQNTNLGKIADIESNLAQGNLSTAQAMNNALLPTTTIESNYKNFYNAAINYALQPDSLLDSTVVYTLANSCPAINGDVVYAARALYNTVNQTNIYFESNCPYDSLSQTPAASVRRANQTAGISTVAVTKTILVYPNPSSGDIYISGSDLTDKQWNVEITDVTGRLVLQNTYQVNQGLIKLNTQLNNGVYLVKVITANGQVQQQKVIISK
jgi:hypothetical protein